MAKWVGISEKMDVVRSHQHTWPIDVVGIARALGVDVYENAGWPDDISGQIARSGSSRSGFVITINSRHHKRRKRFTVAHEIAHYVLHQELIGDGVVDDALFRSRLGGRIEVQANELAADILMPWHLINRAMELGFNTMERLAEIFDVSKSAMSIRLGVPYENE